MPGSRCVCPAKCFASSYSLLALRPAHVFMPLTEHKSTAGCTGTICVRTSGRVGRTYDRIPAYLVQPHLVYDTDMYGNMWEVR